MGTAFRVDRAQPQDPVPIGMNSLLYLGDSEQAAQRAFELATPGFNAWNAPDPSYGVTMSRWHGQHSVGEYRVVKMKTLATKE